MADDKKVAKGANTYKVVTALRCDGKHRAPGTTVTMTAKDAKPLLDLGTIAPITDDKAAE
jgi:hypothetical protein